MWVQVVCGLLVSAPFGSGIFLLWYHIIAPGTALSCADCFFVEGPVKGTLLEWHPGGLVDWVSPPSACLRHSGESWESGHLPHPIRLTAVLQADKGSKGIRGNYQASSLFRDLMGLATVIVPAVLSCSPPPRLGWGVDIGGLRLLLAHLPHSVEWQLKCLGALSEFSVAQQPG